MDDRTLIERAAKAPLDLQQKIEGNIWDHLSDVIPTLKAASDGKWCWTGNSKCKYIELRIDMRTGHCIIRDREGNRIDPTMLQYQPDSRGGTGWPKRNDEPPSAAALAAMEK